MSHVFRRLKAGEAQLLGTAEEEVFDNPFDLERAKRFLSDPSNILIVAIEENRVIGQIAAVVSGQTALRRQFQRRNPGKWPKIRFATSRPRLKSSSLA